MKKILCGLLATIMLMSFSVSASSYTDVPVTTESIEVLNDLGIMKGTGDNKFEPDAYLTRAEGTTFIIRLLGLEEAAISATGTKVDFTDVPADHWATGYIAIAVSEGIIAGMGDGTFEPDTQITYAQFVKMLVAALGYNPQAAESGEWPGNYLSVAKDIKLTTGFTIQANDPVKRSDIAKLAYAALTIPKMEKNGVGVNAVYAPGDNLILDDLGLAKVKGSFNTVNNGKITISTGKICIAENGKYVENSIEEDESVVLDVTNITDIDAYANIPCTFFYDITDEENIAVSVIENKNVTTFTLTSKDIKNYDKDTNRLYYYTNKDANKTAYVKVNPDSAVKYNLRDSVDVSGEKFSSKLEDVFNKTKDYAIELKSVNNDSKFDYDYVAITEYTYVVVKEVKEYKSKGEYRINDYVFKTEEENYDVTFVNKDIEDIEENDILNMIIVDNDDDVITKATITVEGSIVEDTVRYVSNNIITMKSGAEYSVYGAAPLAGLNATFYVSFDNKVIHWNTDRLNSEYEYAFVTDIDFVVKKNEVKSATIRMLTTDGNWITADLRDSIKVDGHTKKFINEDFVGAFGDIEDEDSANPYVTLNTVVAYKIDSDGLVKDIKLNNDTVGGERKFLVDGQEASFGMYSVDKNTAVFNWTVDPTSAEFTEEDITVSTINIFTHQEAYDITLYNYDNDEDYAHVIYGNFTSVINWELPWVIVVEDAIKTIDDDDEIVYLIKGVQNGDKVEFYISEEDYVEDIVAGDVLNFTDNVYEIIAENEKVIEVDDYFINYVSIDDTWKIKKDTKRLVCGEDIYKVTKDTIITIYEDGIATEGSFSDIEEDTNILWRFDEDNRICEMVIFVD